MARRPFPAVLPRAVDFRLPGHDLLAEFRRRHRVLNALQLAAIAQLTSPTDSAARRPAVAGVLP